MDGKFTPAEIQDARESPKVGDVWDSEDVGREIVYRVSDDEVESLTVRDEFFWRFRPEGWRFRTRNATLVRRGA